MINLSYLKDGILSSFYHFRRCNISFTELKVNEQIRAFEMRVIEENGNSLGILKKDEALKLADSRNLDLVEISPNAKPPVCKLLDYGKFKYEQLKKDKVARKNQIIIVVKEVQFRPNIDKHDLGIKLTHAHEFLEKGFKVRFAIKFRGRELEYKEVKSKFLIDETMKALSDIGELENPPATEDRTIIFQMQPRKK
ncbi:MAG TPA: translation initiation factor IF-3 [Candidatus Goldiibacteriota bacterium]|nr:translation initiation factor IF-3 [Candidatus Goldiibacteriota bacterium]HPN65588.1 translation initiation factor IF-3 [Candidatus Goldiibacteriota bacterium]HRQ43367.1 translation initiation factor IF-3 [Candidatus Goldiibacteriota bacterium]